MFTKTPFRLLLILLISLSSCIVIVNKSVKEGTVERLMEYRSAASVKLHLHNGDLVLVENGFTVNYAEPDTFIVPRQIANRYDLNRQFEGPVDSVALSQIAFIEFYRKPLDGAPFLSSIPITGFTIYAAAWAIYGSCPTYYSLEESAYFLEGEGFSYSISETQMGEDLDKLEHGRVTDGIYRLEMRNEAFETHYIDRLEIWSAIHPVETEVFPAIKPGWRPKKKRRLMALGEYQPIRQAIDARGQDIRPLITERDSFWYRSPEHLIDSTAINPTLRDGIEATVDVPADQEEIYLVLRMRNTLLNTTLFYDLLLDGRNLDAPAWIGRKASSLPEALRLARWIQKHFGLHIQVKGKNGWETVDRFPDEGPLAWSYLATTLPVKEPGPFTLRLNFLPDQWMIDWIGVSLEGQADLPYQVHPAMLDKDSFPEDFRNEVNERLDRNDHQFLITYPGHAVPLTFAVGPAPAGEERSLFLASKGFYIEWIRQEWLRPAQGEAAAPILHYDEALIEKLYQQWIEKRPSMKQHFFNSRIPCTGNNEL